MASALHEVVDAAGSRRPDHEAFRFDSEALTYAELLQRAGSLAAVLQDCGVMAGDRVGIYMNKSLELPVAVYGILAAGAAFVPLDPGAPAERIRFMVEDCGIRHVITNASRERAAAKVAAVVPTVEHLLGTSLDAPDAAFQAHSWADIFAAAAARAIPRLGTEDLAYVMYTSGSTGSPKGLMHTHGSGLAYARFSAREYGVVPDDRLGNHSPLHFDMSTFEYLTGPSVGSTTVIIPEEATMFPVSLAELIERERLTFWYSVPLALVQLLERGELADRDCSSLRWVLFGGEPFPPKHLARLAELWPGARFSNSYGPAEVNQCTAFHVPAGDIDTGRPIPIGPVWEGAEGLVLDAADAQVAAGEPGELLIRAPTMMRGYWNRPDLDAAAFHRPDDSPAPYYRTGDLVRDRGDGNLVFLGRKDRQVKVRGYRVELEEVEAVINACAGVAEAAAVDLRDTDGAASIIAAVLPRAGAELDALELRNAAARSLPAYAVPTRVEVRTTMPRTGSGKIDRGALRQLLVANSDDSA